MELAVRRSEKRHSVVTADLLRIEKAVKLAQRLFVDVFGRVADQPSTRYGACGVNVLEIVAVDRVFGEAIVTVTWLRSTFPTRVRLPCDTSTTTARPAVWIAPRTVSRSHGARSQARVRAGSTSPGLSMLVDNQHHKLVGDEVARGTALERLFPTFGICVRIGLPFTPRPPN
ncbi:hypothetical protein F2981_24030 (plasmid) [Sinorhizobium meliloti]|nr:hypothetical protein [Sinorhizobium meliloti]